MEEKIKISAIINTKNNENRLCETLESIKDFDEIILIDEHSSDDTVEIAKEYVLISKTWLTYNKQWKQWRERKSHKDWILKWQV